MEQLNHYQPSTSPYSSTNTPSTFDIYKNSYIKIGSSLLTTACLAWCIHTFEQEPLKPQVIKSDSIRPAVAPQAITNLSEIGASSRMMITAIMTNLGLNHSQAADAAQVTRQTIYNWLAGKEAEGKRLERLSQLYQLAFALTAPIESHLIARYTEDGSSNLLHMLSEPTLNVSRIQEWIAQLQTPTVSVRSQELEDILARHRLLGTDESKRANQRDAIRFIQG